jgi:4-amino-4-deoxy-L-arabinose transferase-like glycosyltransferase
MNFDLHRDRTPRLPLLALGVLASVYLLAGILGHDPWKGEDAVHLAIAHGFWQGGSWLVPSIAGEPWAHTAPLYHWVAALLGGLLAPMLAFHDAARLATTLFGILFLVALTGAARSFHGETASRIAPLLAIGTIGLLVSLHEAQPAIAGLACAALAWWGAGLLINNQRQGAILLGLGLGLAFAAHGLVGLLMAGAVLPAPIFRRDIKSLFIALLIALPLALAWPLMLRDAAPGALSAWWQNEWAEATLGRHLPRQAHLELIAWATWPILPLSLWGTRVLPRDSARLWLPLAGVFLGLAWYLSGPARTLSLFPAVIPMILLASAGAERLRRGATNAFDWFGAITFSLIAALIWLGASALALGWPAPIARNFAKLAPGHDGQIALSALLFAIAASLGWLIAWRLPRAPWRSSLRWAAGATMMWVLVTTLWMGWIDHYKNYRPVALSLRSALPEPIDCIERNGLGNSQRAMLDYFAGIRTVAPSRARNCTWRLAIDDLGRETPTGWVQVWQGARPSDRKERWYLERRED